MSRINGEKSRSAVATRRRNVMRMRSRQLRRSFLETRPQPPTAAPPEAPTTPKKVAAPAAEPAAPTVETPKRARRKPSGKPSQ